MKLASKYVADDDMPRIEMKNCFKDSNKSYSRQHIADVLR